MLGKLVQELSQILINVENLNNVIIKKTRKSWS